ncbi:hypothetical protein [Sphaerisporangium corydalis]|uniref:Bacterial CdiA-CT RNAse A domain-containing protein n=1 Tax=Sphaerisporangium corydalis TaxID=1441875 RepID=A0ABV9EH65_9ACTN|nr:hypothetical protein [Sphaerisporangium corydalis]
MIVDPASLEGAARAIERGGDERGLIDGMGSGSVYADAWSKVRSDDFKDGFTPEMPELFDHAITEDISKVFTAAMRDGLDLDHRLNSMRYETARGLRTIVTRIQKANDDIKIDIFGVFRVPK